MKFIDPRIDFAFKKIFGSEDTKEVLISFLESLLGLKKDKRIKEITILDPYQLPKIKGLKTSILDVKCLDHRGVWYTVEMQVRKVRGFLERIQYNAAKAYVHQIKAAEDYPKLNQVIAVTITDFTFFDDLDGYVSRHFTREEETGKNYLNAIAHYFIELSKFKKKDKELLDVLDKWIFFIKETSILEEIPESLNHEPFIAAFENARRMNMSEEEFELYEKAGMALTDEKGAIELALEEGMEKGIKKGIEKGIEKGKAEKAFEMAKTCLQEGLSMDMTSKLTGLSAQKIAELMK